MALAFSSAPVFRELIGQIRKAFIHNWSLFLIALFAVAFGIRWPGGILETNVHEMASSVFQVAGTMVALILPAAEMAYNFISILSDKHIKFVNQLDITPAKKHKALTDEATTTKQHLYPAWRASVYVFCSFLLSIVAMNLKPICTPSFAINTALLSTRCDISFNLVMLGGAIGFLVIGAFWFLPAIWFAFSLKSLDNVFKSIDLLYRQTARGSSTTSEGPQQQKVTPVEVQHGDASAPPSKPSGT